MVTSLTQIPTFCWFFRCLVSGLCRDPVAAGVYFNPTTRLAMLGKCTSYCGNGLPTYEWTVEAASITISGGVIVRNRDNPTKIDDIFLSGKLYYY